MVKKQQSMRKICILRIDIRIEISIKCKFKMNIIFYPIQLIGFKTALNLLFFYLFENNIAKNKCLYLYYSINSSSFKTRSFVRLTNICFLKRK